MLFMILLGLTLAPASFTETPEPAFSANAAATAQQQGSLVVPPFEVDSPRQDCPDIGPRIADERGRSPRARRLDELPQGQLEYAVFRQVDGCAIRAVVHENAGGSSEPEEGDRR